MYSLVTSILSLWEGFTAASVLPFDSEFHRIRKTASGDLYVRLSFRLLLASRSAHMNDNSDV